MREALPELVDRAERIDAYLAEETEHSRSRIQRLIREGCVFVNDALVEKPGFVLKLGDRIALALPEPQAVGVEPERIPIDVVYEDADLCVVNKPQGMVVHPGPGHASGTLVNALLYRISDLSGIGGELRPGVVHRIDRMTSGLLVVAKNDFAHQALSEQFKTHAAGRQYLAIADGNFKEDSGRIEGAIGRHPTDRKRMTIRADGREAVTHWSVVHRFGTHTLLRLRLETGRTHQIRVHLASIHHPVTGDTVYGAAKNRLGLTGQALHGYRLHIAHPRTGEEMDFFAPLPQYFLDALHRLGFQPDAKTLCPIYETPNS